MLLKKFLQKQMYAMPTGHVNVNINGNRVEALVDSGSELNLISCELAETLNLPIDRAGSAYSVGGVNGGKENMHGCCHTIPIEIGGLRYNHIFFVKNGSLGTNGHMILRTPWMFGHKSRLVFSMATGTPSISMQIYVGGNLEGESVIVQLEVNPDQENNQLIQPRYSPPPPSKLEAEAAIHHPNPSQFQQIGKGLYVNTAELMNTYQRAGASPPRSALKRNSPPIPSVGRSYSSAL